MTRRGKALAVLLLALTMLQFVAVPAEAAKGIEWCVKDPIFEIDGRVVRVELLVPTTHQTATVHFVLAIAPGSSATWRLPSGEVLTGTVTIVTDDDLDRNTASVLVIGEGSTFAMRVQVSGDGLRTAPFEKRGTSEGTRVRLPLQRIGR